MSTTTTDPDPAVNPALGTARALLTAIGSGDLSLVDESVTDDFVDHGSPVPIPPGPEGYRRILTYVATVLDVRYELCEEIVTSDRIVVRARAHGRGVAAVHGPEAAGKPYAMDTVHVFRTEGPRLAEHWGVRDELGALVQLGVLPAVDPTVLEGGTT